MALDISQIVAVSYPAVLAEMRKAANQWAENTALKMLEKQGCIKRVDFGDHIEAPLDYRANPDGGVLVSDQDAASMLKTEVFTAASYDIAQISYPVTWTKGDDAKNSAQAQKVAFVKGLLENGINSHDDLIERAIFTTTSAGGVEINGLDTLVPDSGQGTVGGIDAGVETFWRNYADTYTDSTDIEATMTTAYNTAAKGSGSPLAPKFLLSGATAYAMYEAQLQTLQRFSNTSEADGGFKSLLFKSIPYAFSQYGDDHIYFLNPKNFNMVVSRQYFRDKDDTNQVPGQNASYFLIYSALQNVTDNKSRLAVVSQ